MDDPFFNHTVTYLCEHNDDGAMGLVVNHPIDITVGELLDQIDIENDKSSQAADVRRYWRTGTHRPLRFVLHTPKMAMQPARSLALTL